MARKVARDEVTIDDRNMPSWKDGYHDMWIGSKMIEAHKEQWDKIKTIVE